MFALSGENTAQNDKTLMKRVCEWQISNWWRNKCSESPATIRGCEKFADFTASRSSQT
jgi:hypothetical protein